MSAEEAQVTAPPAPWIAAQTETLLKQRGHAWLLQGPSGLGQYELALALVRAWLCDQPTKHGACNSCTSCHAIDVKAHVDLFILMPETIKQELDWPLSEKALHEIATKPRKPSKQIRVDEMRDAIEFAQRTAGRGRGKAILVYPAEQMNQFTANAMLKILEEPPGDLKFVLSSEAAHELIPTIRSRCQMHTLTWPAAAESQAWMMQQGIRSADTEPLLRASGGRPAEALNFAQTERTPATWQSFPKAMAKGDASFVMKWLPADLLDAQQKLCHDLMAAKSGAVPRFFKTADLPSTANLPSYEALAAWHKSLTESAKTVDHPFKAELMLEALVSNAQRVMLVRR